VFAELFGCVRAVHVVYRSREDLPIRRVRRRGGGRRFHLPRRSESRVGTARFPRLTPAGGDNAPPRRAAAAQPLNTFF